MILRKLILLFLVLTISPLSLAGAGGDWIASGGEIFQLDKNPWFLRNTKTVEYCIEIDSASMSVDLEQVKASVEEAIHYWKGEFAKGQGGGTPGKPGKSLGSASLGTQEFIYRSTCAEGMLLKIKAGHSTLSEEEIEVLEDPKKYIGVTVRKSENYDRAEMRASGFVYIASDIGSNAYENKGHLIDRAWSKPNLLTYTLIHEFGHIFGIAHSGTGIMSEVFMEELLHKKTHKDYLEKPLKSFLHPPKVSYASLVSGGYDANFLGAPAGTVRIKIVQKNLDEYQIFAVGRSGNPWEKELGVFRLLNADAMTLAATPVSIIHLPKEQKVFSLEEQFLSSFLFGPFYTQKSGTGAYFKKGSRKPHPVYIDLKPESMNFVSFQKGRAKPVLVYSSNRLLRMAF